MAAFQMDDLVRFARVSLALNLRPGEEVLIITDTTTEESLPKAVAVAAVELGCEPSIVTIQTRRAPNAEPPRAVAEAAKGAELLVMIASQPMLHTEAMRGALAAGARFLGMAGMTTDLMTQGAATVDPKELFAITERAASVLTAAQSARVTSPHGTDVRMDLTGRKAHILAGVCLPDSPVTCFPDGESPIAPLEEGTEGTIVFDTAMNPFGHLSEPVVLTVERGRITRIEGGPEAQRLSDLLASKGDPGSYLIGEFALGTNPRARITDNMFEVKRRWGTVHFGLGDNATLGGRNHAAIHLDGLVLCPTVTLDGRVVAENGELKV